MNETHDANGDDLGMARADPAAGQKPGERFQRSAGVLAGKIRIAEDFEFSESEIDEMLGQ